MGGKEAAAACRWVAKGAAIFISRYERGLPSTEISNCAPLGVVIICSCPNLFCLTRAMRGTQH